MANSPSSPPDQLAGTPKIPGLCGRPQRPPASPIQGVDEPGSKAPASAIGGEVLGGISLGNSVPASGVSSWSKIAKRSLPSPPGLQEHLIQLRGFRPRHGRSEKDSPVPSPSGWRLPPIALASSLTHWSGRKAPGNSEISGGPAPSKGREDSFVCPPRHGPSCGTRLASALEEYFSIFSQSCQLLMSFLNFCASDLSRKKSGVI